jgi:gliding motility-associated-like protein
VRLKLCKFLFILLLFNACPALGQDVVLYQQYNGRFDFTFIGNTLNPQENSFQDFPTIFTTSSANLTLNSNDEIESAFLYWAGSGTGDFNVKLNNVSLTPDRTFSHQRNNFGLILDYFSAFKDITNLVQQTGNGTYTLSELDVTPFIEQHYLARTNFAGWAIIIVYKNNSLPLNQVNIYDGFQAVPEEVNITLDFLNVIDNQDAKIGFLAWEGDVGIQVNETLRINGTILGNPPLNPSNNAFNGTNSITGSNTLYNMDLDVYNIQDNIDIGDTSATIQLTSGQDVVMINAIVTKLNSQLPDATISVDEVQKECNSRTINVGFTVSNLNSTNPLPAGTPIAIYANGQFIQYTETLVEIPIDGSISDQILLVIPDSIPVDFELLFVVDDLGNGQGIVTEILENNNTFSLQVSLFVSPSFNVLETLISCNEGLGKGTFDFSHYEELVKMNSENTVQFYETFENATAAINPILITSNYVALSTPTAIFVRIDNENCYTITSFLLTTRNCPPIVYNYVSANGDNFNETFFIAGLRNIFLNFELEIFNRWGKLIWKGNNNTEDWNGVIKEGFGSQKAPDGTYFYLLNLNDPDYLNPLSGFLFLNR